MASITSLGIGSGLDIGGLIKDMVSAERQPTEQRLLGEEARTQAEISGLGSLKSAISEFTASLETLRDTTTFATRKASSGDLQVFTTSADDTAVPGSYSVDVVRLAAAHKLRSAGFASASAAVGAGTLNLSVGASTFAVAVTAGNDSLAEIRDAINDAADNAGVSATVVTVDDGAGGSESRLVLAGTGTGTGNALAITVTDADGNDTDNAGLSRLVYDPAGSGVTNLTELQPATDALVRIDGMDVTRSVNSIDDAIDGVTLNLVATGSAVDLTVVTDEAAVRTAIDGFVSGYNSLAQTLGSLSAYDPDTGRTGLLFADATLTAVERSVSNGIAATVSTSSGAITHLTQLGITTQADGTLSVDATRLSAALAAGLDGVGEFFAGTEGLAAALDTALSPYTSSTGIIASRTDTLGEQIDDIGEQRDALDERMASFEARLLAQFTAMDSLVSELQATSSFLSQQFAALGSLTSKRSS